MTASRGPVQLFISREMSPTTRRGEVARSPAYLHTGGHDAGPAGCLLDRGGAVLSMHKLVAGDGYTYLTRHVAAGDTGLEPGQSLTGYYEQTGNPAGRWLGEGLAGLGDGALSRVTPGDRVTEA